jgi:serine/threonine protein kinase
MIEKTLAHYEITSQLGKGGMGEVFLADGLSLNRKGALKFLPDAFTGDPERMARFEREAKLLASLNHPNIAAIYGLEQGEGKRFLVLELVEGETLAQRLSREPLPVEEALGICRRIADALEAAHKRSHSSGSEACQRDDHRRRQGQGTRLRAGKAAFSALSNDVGGQDGIGAGVCRKAIPDL